MHSGNFWGKAPIAIAHRGGDAAGPKKENTLAAFKAAQEMGCRYGETDVILAAGGEVVCLHGSRNALQAGIRGDFSRPRLQKMTLPRIRKTLKSSGIQVPTLEELLAQFPKMRFLIDPKTDEVVLPLAKTLQQLNAGSRVCVGSFSYNRVRQFLRLTRGDKIPTSFIIGRGLRLVNGNLHMLKTGRLKDVEAIQLHHSLVSREMVDLVHKRGFKAVVWTANSPLSIKNAIICGADGIISDRVELLKDILAGQD